MKKPYGVYWLLSDGERWMYSQERTLEEALTIARTLRAHTADPGPLFVQERVWIAAPAQVGVRGTRRTTRA